MVHGPGKKHHNVPVTVTRHHFIFLLIIFLYLHAPKSFCPLSLLLYLTSESLMLILMPFRCALRHLSGSKEICKTCRLTISPLMFFCCCFWFSETGQVDSVLIERYNTPGFVGCLSRVQFNRITPLKAALRLSAPAHTSVQGVLVESNCGALPLTIPAMSVTFNPWQPDSGETVRMMGIVIIYTVLYENHL